ncbi:MAG: hypothetical protein ACREJB_02295 [Planctomycetaceae bacterium]
MRRLGLLTVVTVSSMGMISARAAEEPVFSGPQPGETLAPFKVRGVFDEDAGKELDLVTAAAGKPTLIIFMHQATRPSVAVTRTVLDYAATRKKDGLATGLVYLADDATEAEAFLKRARHALPKETPIGISTDGAEGPGAYGLNRNVTLTVLIAREGKVTANFALVQPSLQADVPRILDELVKLIGGTAPTLEELQRQRRRK